MRRSLRLLEGRSSWARAALAVAAAVLLLNLVALAAGAVAPGPSGPRSSSYATSPAGLRAYADLLERQGHRVERILERPDAASLDPASTVVVLDPDVLVAVERRALRRFVEDGGRLLAGGRNPEVWLDELLGDAPRWREDAPETGWRALAPVAAAGGAGGVRTAGAGAWQAPRGALPAVGTSPAGPALVVVRPLGRGEAVLLADASPLQNRLLGAGGNAALGLGLAGGQRRPVAFVESVHGHGAGRGLGALPARWRLALAGLALAALLLVLSRARRLGPPESALEASAPPRQAYVDALSAALARSGDPAAAAVPLQRAARRRLAARFGAGAGAGTEATRAAAVSAGLDQRAADALAGEIVDEDGLVVAARALSALERASPRGVGQDPAVMKGRR